MQADGGQQFMCVAAAAAVLEWKFSNKKTMANDSCCHKSFIIDLKKHVCMHVAMSCVRVKNIQPKCSAIGVDLLKQIVD